MGKFEQPALSDAEREVLRVLWEMGPLGVRDVLTKLTESGQDWTRSTVVTLLRRLEAKRYVTSDKSQYAFVYRPLVSREDVMHARMSAVAGELSDGNAVPLMLAFAERQRFSPEEIARLQQMVDDLKRRIQRRKKPT
jgi:BlaI family transcriptional regulator, penicillinase repressor